MLAFIWFFGFLLATALAQWPRWEERTLDCSAVTQTDQCILLAPKAKVARDPAKYRCRREPMPQTEWNTLARSSKTRIACPLGCEPDADLSVIQKKPIDNKNCQKYYTYGKYRDEKANEWFLWVTDPCLSTLQSLTTHCRFRDIPLYPGAQIPAEIIAN